MKIASSLGLIAAAFLLASCASWSTASVEPLAASGPLPVARSADAVIVTENDITDRPYRTLGDITVTVNKTTIFNKDPTREMVAARLREEAAKLGADAVVLARYGAVGFGLLSWGSMEGKGRAVSFAN
jgi:uncharacterized protein YbjQ (UPF0145 family)